MSIFLFNKIIVSHKYLPLPKHSYGPRHQISSPISLTTVIPRPRSHRQTPPVQLQHALPLHPVPVALRSPRRQTPPLSTRPQRRHTTRSDAAIAAKLVRWRHDGGGGVAPRNNARPSRGGRRRGARETRAQALHAVDRRQEPRLQVQRVRYDVRHRQKRVEARGIAHPGHDHG